MLKFGPLGASTVHLCVDMQRLFAEPTDWATPWMKRVLPNAVRLSESHPERCVFSRFIPAREPGMGHGTWKPYYERWHSMTIVELGEDMVRLVPELERFTPPGLVVDKHVYSPWYETGLDAMLKSRGVDTLVISGGETEVCVLATVLGAIDFGYRVVLATDALCSSADPSHDAMISIYEMRYGMQVEPATTAQILAEWP